MDVLTGQGLHNVLVVVTRYFGGTLLGTGGLVRAYSAAVKAGLENCVIQEKIRGCQVHFVTDYNGLGKIQHIAAGLELPEKDAVYGEKVELTYLVPTQKVDQLEREVTEKTGGRTGIDREEETWIYWNT